MTLGNQDTELTQGAVGTVQVPSLCALVEQADRVPGVIHLCPVHLLSLSPLSPLRVIQHLPLLQFFPFFSARNPDGNLILALEFGQK